MVSDNFAQIFVVANPIATNKLSSFTKVGK